MKKIAIWCIRLYQLLLSPILSVVLSSRCRYDLSCSEYAKQQISRYGVVHGGRLAIKRLLSCQPFGRI